MSGGVLLGLGLGLIHGLLTIIGAPPTGFAFGLGALAVLAMFWAPAATWLPGRRRQVSSSRMLGPSRSRAAFMWGLELGTALSTFAVTPTLYCVLAVGLAVDSFLGAVFIGTTYGLARGLTIATVSSYSGPTDVAGGPIGARWAQVRGLLRPPLLAASVLTLPALVISTQSS